MQSKLVFSNSRSSLYWCWSLSLLWIWMSLMFSCWTLTGVSKYLCLFASLRLYVMRSIFKRHHGLSHIIEARFVESFPIPYIPTMKTNELCVLVDKLKSIFDLTIWFECYIGMTITFPSNLSFFLVHRSSKRNFAETAFLVYLIPYQKVASGSGKIIEEVL